MTRTLTSFFVLLFIGISNLGWSQNENNPVLLEIGERKINLADFEAVYRKNNSDVNQKSLEEYLDLYVNFRLKVEDAEALGMDTMPKFKRELAGYRKQLAEPYLSDNEVTDALIKEAYERMKNEMAASHIMVSVGPNASPEDTLKAYRKSEQIKKRILKGEDFAKVAKELSDDPSAKDNGGYLGYFTALYMVYSFESAVYNNEVGSIVGPVRTQFGYHIIKVEGKRENRGEITVAHIMTRLPQEPNPEQQEASRKKINEIYDKLMEGENFEEMCAQYSEDKTTANRGGVLPPFSAGKMVLTFEEAAFALENDGDISKPVETQYGFHIIKRIKNKKVGTFKEMQPELKDKISRDGRSRRSKISFIKRIKTEYNFKENIDRKKDFYTAIDSSYFKSVWKADQVSQLNKELFTLGDSSANQMDFANYLAKNQPRRGVYNIPSFIDRMYESYVEKFCTDYEDSRLESKYPEFRLLMQEYHDGILLFDLTDEKVWSKAVKDSTGLEAFYQEHKNEYMWGDRVDAALYSVVDEATANEVRKMLKAKKKKGYSDSDILKQINESSQLNLEIEHAKFSKGDNAIVDEFPWKKGISDNMEKNNRIYFLEVTALLKPQPKKLDEVKGLMTSAYQSHLEEQWINELKQKYPVKVYKEHLSLIK